MPNSNYPNGWANGVVIRGMPVLNSYPGSVFWADSVNGSNGNPGTYTAPFASINGAIVACTAGRGDIIVLKPGHAETITGATGIVLNKSSVAIVGLGVGSARATITYGTAATANIPVTAANVSVYNVLHKANFADVVSAYTATGTSTPTDLAIVNCEFRDGSTVLNFLKTVTGNATANSMDGFTYTFNRVLGLSTTAASMACIMAAATNRQTYQDNFVVYPVLNDTPCLVDFGANATLNLDMGRNKVFRPSTSTTGGSLFAGGSTTSTGYVYDNYSWHLDNTAALLAPTGTKLGFQNNYCMITGAADKSGLINPAAV